MSTDLIQEIRRARENLRHKEAQASEAGFTLRMARESEKKARAELDQLLDELETGQSRYTLPGFDRLEIPAASPNGTADERQRGPTTFPATVAGPIDWSTRDLDGALLAALRVRGPHGESGHWESLKQAGCDDQKILETLAATWPRKPRYDRDAGQGDRVGRTVRGGSTPAIWIGMRSSIDQLPVLSGLELAARVRTVLDLPQAPGPELEPVPDSTKPRNRNRS
jgi:hypothetical protein